MSHSLGRSPTASHKTADDTYLHLEVAIHDFPSQHLVRHDVELRSTAIDEFVRTKNRCYDRYFTNSHNKTGIRPDNIRWLKYLLLMVLLSPPLTQAHLNRQQLDEFVLHVLDEVEARAALLHVQNAHVDLCFKKNHNKRLVEKRECNEILRPSKMKTETIRKAEQTSQKWFLCSKNGTEQE